VAYKRVLAALSPDLYAAVLMATGGTVDGGIVVAGGTVVVVGGTGTAAHLATGTAYLTAGNLAGAAYLTAGNLAGAAYLTAGCWGA
jgi:hypothetical protein